MDESEKDIMKGIFEQLQRIADSLENMDKKGISAICSGTVYNRS